MFRVWFGRVSDNYIVLKAKYDDVAPSWKVLKSGTRFTSKKRKKRISSPPKELPRHELVFFSVLRRRELKRLKGIRANPRGRI